MSQINQFKVIEIDSIHWQNPTAFLMEKKHHFDEKIIPEVTSHIQIDFLI